MLLRFLSAAGTVTGSRALLQSGDTRLLVDCGMFQGYRAVRERNWTRLEVEPASLEAVVLTHAHLDHSGWLPRLVQQGFRGPIHCTSATADLLGVLLRDAARIQEEDAEYANRKGFSRHDPALPLYTTEDAERTLELLQPVGWAEPRRIGDLRASWHRVGHILGAACVRLADEHTSVLFSGDVGRPQDLLMRPPAAPPSADAVVLESTYGDRAHADEAVLEQLEPIVRRVVRRRGVLLIPSFAVGRAQAVLWALHTLQEQGRIPDVPLVLDSPMATNTTELYRRHARELRIPAHAVEGLCRDVRFVRTTDESKRLNDEPGPFILVSASGMLTGGRVLHHLARLAPDPANALLLVGYQAPGTRGAKLLRGAESLRVHGREVPIGCEVRQVDGFSAHADAEELVGWIEGMERPPLRVWLNHGEPASARALQRRLRERTGWSVIVASEDTRWRLDALEPSRAAL